jgi:polyhydroxyalkanoate synthesis regulator phasin
MQKPLLEQTATVGEVNDPPKQFDLFPTSEPEIKGQLAAFAAVLRGLIETLMANGSLTREQAKTLVHHSDLKTAFAIWDELEGEMPPDELKRMQEQATRYLDALRRDIFG